MMILGEYSNDIVSDEANLQSLAAALKRYCLSLTKSAWDAEDLAQDTWVKGLTALKNSTHTNPEALLLRIAKNTWIDTVRRNAVYHRILEEMQIKETQSHNHSALETEILFHALIKHLSPLQRIVFLLRDVLGYSSQETAEMLETTEGAIKSSLHRARQALHAVRKELNTDGPKAPVEEAFITYLSVLALAYEDGDAAAMLELAYANETIRTAAIGKLVDLRQGASLHYGESNMRTELRMAA
ncbi:RNA polymerase sigma factor [Paenibacillus sp. sgz500958]|uniref:RNA polymerase sigma factor n=1 Tax=Paenibacillus sp. sgz500958 TaxID=3242475 RepID=UPI0036D2CA5A